MTENLKDSSGSVFISYSRKHKPFIKKLHEALDTQGVRAWVDWEGIELASDWMETITSAIQSTHALIFVISPDGSLMATGSSEATVILWKVDGTRFTQMGNVLRFNGAPQSLVFSPDNNWLAGGGSSGFAYLWDTATIQQTTRIGHGNPVTSVSFSIDGTQLFTVSRKVIRIWDISALRKITEDKLVSAACTHLVANLGREDWAPNFGEEEYRLLCPNLHEGS